MIWDVTTYIILEKPTENTWYLKPVEHYQPMVRSQEELDLLEAKYQKRKRMRREADARRMNGTQS